MGGGTIRQGNKCVCVCGGGGRGGVGGLETYDGPAWRSACRSSLVGDLVNVAGCGTVPFASKTDTLGGGWRLVCLVET